MTPRVVSPDFELGLARVMAQLGDDPRAPIVARLGQRLTEVAGIDERAPEEVGVMDFENHGQPDYVGVSLFFDGRWDVRMLNADGTPRIIVASCLVPAPNLGPAAADDPAVVVSEGRP